MAIDKNDAQAAVTPRASLTHAPYTSYAENLPQQKSEAEILKALKASEGPVEMIRRPVLKDDQLAGTDPDKMTVEEARRLSQMQAERRAQQQLRR